MNYDYSVEIVWSKEDGAYLASIQELPGCTADGQTREEALQNVTQMAQEWVDVAKELKRQIPPPMSVEDCLEQQRKFQESVNQHIQHTIAKAVSEIVPKAVKQIVFELRQEEEGQWRCLRGRAKFSGRQVDVVR